MSGPYHYGIGPWVWNAAEACWEPPAGAVCALDLRSLPDASVQTLGDRPHGFFAAPVALGGDYAALGVGDCRELASSGAMRDAWDSLLGYRPSGATLLDLLWDHLTNGADPEGQDRCKPLIPTLDGHLDLYLAGHSLVRREAFTRAHPHWNQVAAVHQADFARMVPEYDTLAGRERGEAAQRLRDVPAKVLGGLCQQYRIGFDNPGEWRLLLPPSLRSTLAPKKPETTITDDFNRANSATLGSSAEGWSWSEQGGGNWDIDTNAAEPQAADSVARADADLSSADHAVQASVTAQVATSNPGVLARFSASVGNTYYMWRDSNDGNVLQLFKRVTGTFTQIGLNVSETPSPTFTLRLTVSGSSLDGLLDGVSKRTATDTSITANVRTGLRDNVLGTKVDNFLAEDLAATVVARQAHALALMGVQ